MAGGLLALGLVGCGGGDDNAKARQSTEKVDSTKGNPGGKLVIDLQSSPPTLDKYSNVSFPVAIVSGLAYSGLLALQVGQQSIEPTYPVPEPDLAVAMPEQVDQTTMVFKLRSGVTFHNGRALTSEDVRYSLNRYATDEKSPYRVSWAEWFDSVVAPDASTVVVKTNGPNADAIFAITAHEDAFIIPQGHAEGPNAATSMMGTGPYVLADYQQDVSLTFRKHVAYHLKPFPYFDEVQVILTRDVFKRVADFSAHAVDYPWFFEVEDRDRVKANRPDAASEAVSNPSDLASFRTDKPPFNDKRVRQALSMMLDRKKALELQNGEGELDQALWVGNTGIGARKVADLGPSAKYWNYDPQAATQLLRAAAQEGLSTTFYHADASAYGQPHVDRAELIIAQLNQAGVRVRDMAQPYATYLSTTYAGNYEGMGFTPNAVSRALSNSLVNRYYTSPDGKAGARNLSRVNDPKLNDLIKKQQGELDFEERKKTLREVETLLAEETYYLATVTRPLTWFWNPSLRNVRPTAFRSGSYQYVRRWWFAA